MMLPTTLIKPDRTADITPSSGNLRLGAESGPKRPNPAPGPEQLY